MSKDFVYFFKHLNVNGVKIGKASGESVFERFKSFKTYAPNGAEILGFFECENGIEEERALHKRFAAQRLRGEFFDISIDVVNAIVSERNSDYQKAINMVTEWLSIESNSAFKLKGLLKKEICISEKKESLEGRLLIEFIEKDNNSFMTATQIKIAIEKRIEQKLSIKKLGMELKVYGYDRVRKNNIYGYSASIK